MQQMRNQGQRTHTADLRVTQVSARQNMDLNTAYEREYFYTH